MNCANVVGPRFAPPEAHRRFPAPQMLVKQRWFRSKLLMSYDFDRRARKYSFPGSGSRFTINTLSACPERVEATAQGCEVPSMPQIPQ